MLINLHTHTFTDQKNVIELVNQYPDTFDAAIPFYSIGIHPWHINVSQMENDLIMIESKIITQNCLAIGECGLDKRIETPLDVQVSVFEKQLLLAEKYQKPVIIHCVAAFQEVIALKKRLHISVPMIIHGFSKNAQVAKSLLDNEFYLSFGKYLLRNPELAAVFKSVPENRFFLETDTIAETIFDVYEKAESIRKMKLQETVNVTFETVFKSKIINLKP